MILKAYAKINLTLDIVGKRNDGYHLIDSVFQSVGIFDTVTVNKSDKISVLCGDIGGENNIAFTAAKEFFCLTGISGGADIKIEKGIPLLSGLGGGSADAAAVIIALNIIYGTSLSKEKLLNIALKCGADVPFFLFGGTARVGGIGEKVEPISDIDGYYAVLLKSGEKESTRDMYAHIDNETSLSAVTGEFTTLLNKGEYSCAIKKVSNAFLGVQKNREAYNALKSQNPIGVSLSGSGPTYFAVFGNKSDAYSAVKDLNSQGFLSVAVPFVSRSVAVVE